MLISEMIAKVQSEAGIDADDATVRGWLQDRLKRMVAAAQWRRALVTLGATQADVSVYDVPDDVVDIRTLWIGGTRYARQSIEEVVELQQRRGGLNGARGAWAPQYGGDASEGITIWPTPDATTAGDALEALCAVQAPTVADNAEPPVPVDLQHGIWEGAIADGLGLGDEDPVANEYEAKHLAATEELRARRVSRFGSGPAQIRVRY